MPIIDGKYFKVLKVNTGPTKYRDLTPSKDSGQYKSFMYDSTTDSMIELNKHKPDSMIELNKHKPDSMIEVNKYGTDSMIELNKHKPDSIIELIKQKPDSMIKLNKAQETMGRNRSVNYYPTHFLPSEPLRPFFFGEDEKFNSTEARRNLRAQLKQSLNTMHRMPDMGSTGTNGRGLYVADAPSDDFIRYYFELHDPKIYDYDLLRVTDGSSSPIELHAAKNEAYSSEYAIPNGRKRYLRDNYTETYSTRTKPPFESSWYPDWYLGFTGNTYIEYWPRQDGNGAIRFYGQDQQTGEVRSRVDLGIEYRKNKKHIVTLSRKDTGSEQFEEDIVYVTRVGKAFVANEDFFNKIKFYTSRRFVQLERIKIKYNSETVCDTALLREDGRISNNTIFFPIEYDAPFDITGFLYLTKQRTVRYSSNTVLKTAANELGRAWSPKWRRLWGRGWCGAFTTWLFNESTFLRSLPFWEGKYTYLFFHRNSRLINEFAGYQFGDIYGLVEPGDKIRMTSPSVDVERGDYVHHTTSFVKWKTRKDNSAEFRAIGGNQSRRVKVSTYKALNQSPEEPYIGEGGNFYSLNVERALYFRRRAKREHEDYFANVGPPYFPSPIV